MMLSLYAMTYLPTTCSPRLPVPVRLPVHSIRCALPEDDIPAVRKALERTLLLEAASDTSSDRFQEPKPPPSSEQRLAEAVAQQRHAEAVAQPWKALGWLVQRVAGTIQILVGGFCLASVGCLCLDSLDGKNSEAHFEIQRNAPPLFEIQRNAPPHAKPPHAKKVQQDTAAKMARTKATEMKKKAEAEQAVKRQKKAEAAARQRGRRGKEAEEVKDAEETMAAALLGALTGALLGALPHLILSILRSAKLTRKGGAHDV
jgi:hypothetical protein